MVTLFTLHYSQMKRHNKSSEMFDIVIVSGLKLRSVHQARSNHHERYSIERKRDDLR